jgi:hypothetical protein
MMHEPQKLREKAGRQEKKNQVTSRQDATDTAHDIASPLPEYLIQWEPNTRQKTIRNTARRFFPFHILVVCFPW